MVYVWTCHLKGRKLESYYLISSLFLFSQNRTDYSTPRCVNISTIALCHCDKSLAFVCCFHQLLLYRNHSGEPGQSPSLSNTITVSYKIGCTSRKPFMHKSYLYLLRSPPSCYCCFLEETLRRLWITHVELQQENCFNERRN